MANPLHNVNVPVKQATFAIGCFWGTDSLFGAKKGVIRTRVGYSAGQKSEPNYEDLGDHTECINLEYNPEEVSYNELLNLFWDNHDCTLKTTVQYTSLIVYHDNEQKKIAEDSLKQQQSKKKDIVTKIVPFGKFWDAEGYHQKYRLQEHPSLLEATGLRRGPKLLYSYLAARLNGYVVGFGGVKQFEEEVGQLGLDKNTAEYVRKLVTKFEGTGITC